MKVGYSVADIRRDANAVLQHRALLDAATLGTAGFGAGMGIRSLIALMQQARRNMFGPKHKPPATVKFVPQPVPAAPTEEKAAGIADTGAALWGRLGPEGQKALMGAGLGGLAGGAFGAYSEPENRMGGAMRGGLTGAGLGGLGGFGLGVGQTLTESPVEKVRRAMQQLVREAKARAASNQQLKTSEDTKSSGLAEFMRGDYATQPNAIPWRIPALVGAGAAGLYGGYRLADLLADRYYQNELDTELKREREAFEKALAGGGSKLASAIDELYELTKDAAISDTLGLMAGLYGTYAGGSALLAGKAMYDKAKKEQRRKKIEKAVKQRRAMVQQIRPTSILVTDEMSPEYNSVM